MLDLRGRLPLLYPCLTDCHLRRGLMGPCVKNMLPHLRPCLMGLWSLRQRMLCHLRRGWQGLCFNRLMRIDPVRDLIWQVMVGVRLPLIELLPLRKLGHIEWNQLSLAVDLPQLALLQLPGWSILGRQRLLRRILVWHVSAPWGPCKHRGDIRRGVRRRAI